jgi:hypothetical protein
MATTAQRDEIPGAAETRRRDVRAADSHQDSAFPETTAEQ